MAIDTGLWLCATCGVERGSAPGERAVCPICADERQYLPAGGQRWIRLADLADHRVEVAEREPDLLTLDVEPRAGIGQTALIVRTPAGALMWDCVGFVSDDAVARVRDVADVRWIATSHPHMFGTQVEWARALDAQVLVNAADMEWLQRGDDRVQPWSDRHEVTDGLTLHQLGGHFRGSSVAHWRAGARGLGVLLTGDTIMVNPDQTASFMRSYPNFVPLSAAVVDRLATAACSLEFDRAYNNFGRAITEDAAERIRLSADRHMAWVRGDHDDLT